MNLPLLWQCGRLTARKLGAGEKSDTINTSNNDIFQLNADDGCLYSVGDTHYIEADYIDLDYIGDGSVICPN